MEEKQIPYVKSDHIHKECGNKMIVKEKCFYWRGIYFSGLVCEKCNALYNNPADSFMDHVAQSSSK